MKKPQNIYQYVYWMPTNEPSLVLPNKYQFQAAAVIKAVKGQQRDFDIYFSLLAKRVQRLIEKSGDPEDSMLYTYDILENADLITIYEKPDDVKKAGEYFVFQNFKLQEHLHLAGVFETMPKVLEENSPEAEILYNETDIEGWFSAITTRMPEDDR